MGETQVRITEITNLATDDPKFPEACISLANSIESEKYAITQLVQDLGPLLTNTVIADREKGTLILSLVLTHLPNNILSSTQLNFICNFYSERLNDHHQVVPAVLKGLIPLVNSENIPEGISIQLLNALFQYVPCQQQQQHDRYNIYQFIKALLDKRKEEMKAMGLDLVYGVISAIDSERDPRNLLFLFNWLPSFLSTIELGQLNEEMFDVMSCYFPVDFRPTAQDEHTITRENLADALCPCLCALPSFADLCIPLAIEKLESELYIAKLDSLNLLINGCINFPVDTYKQHCSVIWSLIQKEMFSCKDKDLERRCLEALTCLFRKLSTDTSYSKQQTKDVIDTLKGNLRPDAILYMPSAKVIKSISEASPEIADLIFKEISPLLINMYNITTTPSHKNIILQQLVDLTVIYLSLNPQVNIDDAENAKIVPSICLKAITNTETQIRATGIASFSHLAPFISTDTRRYFYENLSSLIVLKQESIVRETIIAALKTYAALYHEEIQSILQNIQRNNGKESLELYLNAVGSIICIPQLMPFSLSLLVKNIFVTLDSAVIAAKILKHKLEENESIISKYLIANENIIERIVDYFLQNINNLNIDIHQDFLNSTAKILMIVLRYTEKDIQETLIAKQLEKIQWIKSNDLYIVILYGLLCSLRPTTQLSISIDQIINTTIGTPSSDICNIGSELLGNIVNKTLDENALNDCLSNIEMITNTSLQHNQIDNTIKVISFTTKALAIRANCHTFRWVNKLIDLSAKYFNAAKAFEIMFEDGNDCLNTKNYCKKTLLYKQRLFTEVCDYLVSNYNEEKKYYLLILGYLIQNVPQNILRLELKKIIRLILLCLSYCEECDVLYAVLTAINALIEDKEQLAEDFIQEFLKYYLKLATFEKSMKIRILALKGIQIYSTYPLYKLLPLKQDVLMALGKCLDDKKRLVRKEAVEARSKWFVIDAPI